MHSGGEEHHHQSQNMQPPVTAETQSGMRGLPVRYASPIRPSTMIRCIQYSTITTSNRCRMAFNISRLYIRNHVDEVLMAIGILNFALLTSFKFLELKFV